MVRIMISQARARLVLLAGRSSSSERDQPLRIMMAPGGQVEQDMTVIQDAAYKYTSRKKLKEQEGIKGDVTDQGSIAEYVRRLCQGDNVRGRGLDRQGARCGNLKGYNDFTHKVDHSDKKDAVGRGNIANFFWLLERGSSKLKVTDPDRRGR